MASTPTGLMTFAEFMQPSDSQGGRYELRHGKRILMAPSSHESYVFRGRILRLLSKASTENQWIVRTQLQFRPHSEFEFWCVDIGLVSAERWMKTEPDVYLQGSPELVVEIPPPLMSMIDLLDRCQTCLEGGAREYWRVNPRGTVVEVSNPDGRSITYSKGQQVPLFFGGSVAVNDIFRI